MAIRTLFLGTPHFACSTLDVLLKNPSLFEVVGVVTQPDRPVGRSSEPQPSKVREMAQKHLDGVKGARLFPIFTPEKVTDPDFLKVFKQIRYDVAVVVAFGQILPQVFLDSFNFGAVNVHGSLLPRWRGAAPIQHAILNGDKVTGVTLQKVVARLDAGPIIATKSLELDDSWDAPRVYSELESRGAELVLRHLPDYVAGKIVPVEQDETKVTMAPKITKEMGLIDWTKTAVEIERKIRAFAPWPGTWTTRNGKILKILRGEVLSHNGSDCGLLVGQNKMGFIVQCGGRSALQVSVVQPEGRSRMPSGDYMNATGNKFVKGDRLGT